MIKSMYLTVSVSLIGIQSAFAQPAATTAPVPGTQFEPAPATHAAPPAEYVPPHAGHAAPTHAAPPAGYVPPHAGHGAPTHAAPPAGYVPPHAGHAAPAYPTTGAPVYSAPPAGYVPPHTGHAAPVYPANGAPIHAAPPAGYVPPHTGHAAPAPAYPAPAGAPASAYPAPAGAPYYPQRHHTRAQTAMDTARIPTDRPRLLPPKTQSRDPISPKLHTLSFSQCFFTGNTRISPQLAHNSRKPDLQKPKTCATTITTKCAGYRLATFAPPHL